MKTAFLVASILLLCANPVDWREILGQRLSHSDNCNAQRDALASSAYIDAAIRLINPP